MTRSPTCPGRVEAPAGVRGLVAVLVSGLVVLLAGPAAAAVRPAIQVFPAYGPPGTVVRVTGQGFCPKPCSTVGIVVATQEVAVGVTVGSAGTFDTRVRVPGGLPAGTAPVVARQTDASGATVFAASSFDVTPGVPPPTRLPAPTGSPAVQPVPGATSATPSTSRSSPVSTARATATPAGTATSSSSAAAGTAQPSATAVAVSADPGRHVGVSWWWGVLGLGLALVAAGAAGVILRLRRRRP